MLALSTSRTTSTSLLLTVRCRSRRDSNSWRTLLAVWRLRIGGITDARFPALPVVWIHEAGRLLGDDRRARVWNQVEESQLVLPAARIRRRSVRQRSRSGRFETSAILARDRWSVG